MVVRWCSGAEGGQVRNMTDQSYAYSTTAPSRACSSRRGLLQVRRVPASLARLTTCRSPRSVPEIPRSLEATDASEQNDAMHSLLRSLALGAPAPAHMYCSDLGARTPIPTSYTPLKNGCSNSSSAVHRFVQSSLSRSASQLGSYHQAERTHSRQRFIKSTARCSSESGYHAASLALEEGIGP